MMIYCPIYQVGKFRPLAAVRRELRPRLTQESALSAESLSSLRSPCALRTGRGARRPSPPHVARRRQALPCPSLRSLRSRSLRCRQSAPRYASQTKTVFCMAAGGAPLVPRGKVCALPSTALRARRWGLQKVCFCMVRARFKAPPLRWRAWLRQAIPPPKAGSAPPGGARRADSKQRARRDAASRREKRAPELSQTPPRPSTFEGSTGFLLAEARAGKQKRTPNALRARSSYLDQLPPTD
jgi:hypothetical protein